MYFESQNSSSFLSKMVVDHPSHPSFPRRDCLEGGSKEGIKGWLYGFIPTPSPVCVYAQAD